MSNILIKGMEMPKNCPMCPMSHWNRLDEFTGCEIVSGKKYAMNDPEYANSDCRPDWCPLIEVPPHWKLIDMNQVTRYLSHSAEDRDFVRPPVSWKEAFDEIIGVFNDFPGIQSERTSYYEYCNDCPVPFASVDDKEMCGWHWRPKSGTKTGFPDKDGWNCPKDTAISIISMEESARQNVKRGQWIGGELGHCSVCGAKGCASDIWNGCSDGNMFCPNCGADLRQKEET